LTKIFIALKEARETKYRLRLIKETDLYEGNVENYLKDIESIINILTKITKTT
jgi:four helix bundle protein